MPVELVAGVLEVLVCCHNGRKQGVRQRLGGCSAKIGRKCLYHVWFKTPYLISFASLWKTVCGWVFWEAGELALSAFCSPVATAQLCVVLMSPGCTKRAPTRVGQLAAGMWQTTTWLDANWPRGLALQGAFWQCPSLVPGFTEYLKLVLKVALMPTWRLL